MVIVELTQKQIKELEYNSKVISFDIHDVESSEMVEPGYDFSDCLDRNGFTEMKEKTGLTGQGVTIGMVDSDSPYDKDKQITLYNGKVVILGDPRIEEGDSHGGNTVEIIIGEEGIASEAEKLYCVSYRSNGFYKAIELLVKNNLTIINASIAVDGTRTENYTEKERWFDYIINKYGLTVVQSAGNGWRTVYDDEYRQVWEPGGCYNVITVGGMDDNFTDNENDDKMYEGQSYDIYNSVTGKGGCEKPDILAPKNIGGGGTSSSAPVTTGLVALMLELKPSLAAYPQIIKAILMASCHRKVLDPVTGTQTETMEQGLTEKQGAGVIDPYIAICIVGNKQYGIREVGTSGESIDIVQPKYNSSNINVSIAWFHEGVHVTGDNEFSPESSWSTNAHNLSLSLVQNHMMLLGHTDEENSSTEMIYTSMYSAINKYTIDIDGDSAKTTPVTCAYAWSTDKMYFQQPSKQGIYRLKNLNSKLYLDVNTSGNLLQKNYADSVTQEWTIVKSTESSAGSDLYTLTTDGYTGYAGEGVAISTDHVYANMLQTQSSIGVLEYDEYICLYKQLVNSSALACLQPLNSATTSGTRMSWLTVTGADSQKWLLEKVNYCKGDIDKDGVLEAEDANAIQQYIVKTITFTESQKYLADVNDDGEVTAIDANKTLNRVVGLE